MGNSVAFGWKGQKSKACSQENKTGVRLKLTSSSPDAVQAKILDLGLAKDKGKRLSTGSPLACTPMHIGSGRASSGSMRFG
jgi:hypothetical protein